MRFRVADAQKRASEALRAGGEGGVVRFRVADAQKRASEALRAPQTASVAEHRPGVGVRQPAARTAPRVVLPVPAPARSRLFGAVVWPGTGGDVWWLTVPLFGRCASGWFRSGVCG